MEEVQNTQTTATEPGNTTAAPETTLATPEQNTQPTNLLTSQPTEQAEPRPWEFVPEKYLRTTESGELDQTATAQQLAQAYSHLEKRLGSGDVRPETPDLYAPEVAGLNWEVAKTHAAIPEFLSKAHELGMTNAQVSFALSQVAIAATENLPQNQPMTQQDSEKVLREEWGENYAGNLKSAIGAVNNFLPDGEREAFVQRYGNDPQVIKILSRIGAELNEDTIVGLGQPVESAETIEQLMKSEANSNEQHPDHKATRAKVQRYFAKQHGTAAVW